MKRILLILIVTCCACSKSICQVLGVEELLSIVKLPSKSIGHYLSKKNFILLEDNSDSNEMKIKYVEKTRWGKRETVTGRSINICFAEDTRLITLHTARKNDFIDGRNRLIRSGYYFDTSKNVASAASILFQKSNISVETKTENSENIPLYSFALKQKKIPVDLKYADDLLHFDSHELLVAYFGEQNVKKDMYYLTEKELKKCSVLFSGTAWQVVFVWNDDIYLSKLFYLIVTNHLPTKGGENSNPLAGNNRWQLKNGIYPGMPLRDLLKINEMDFDIYGNKSEFSFLVKPNENGKVDFKKTAIMLNCTGCYNNKIFNSTLVSALEVARSELPMKVFDVVIYASVK